MFYTPQRCKNAWDDEKRSSYLGDSYSHIEDWSLYWNYLAAQYPSAQSGYQNDIITMLQQNGILKSGQRILDIGCGPGTYSIPFAALGASSVHCVDSSQGMLDQLELRAREHGLLNKLVICHCTWDDFRSNDKFDFVFSSLSPAISEYSELMRMECYSSDYCCLVTYGANPPHSIRNIIWEKLLGKLAESHIFNAIYPYNVLYSLGRHPNINTFSQQKNTKMAIENVIEDAIRYFNIFGYKDKHFIRNIIISQAQDGYIYENNTAYYSAIWWRNTALGE